MDKVKVKIDRFNRKDFGLHWPLSREKLDSIKQGEWELFDRQALDVICLILVQNIAFSIANEKITTVFAPKINRATDIEAHDDHVIHCWYSTLLAS